MHTSCRRLLSVVTGIALAASLTAVAVPRAAEATGAPTYRPVIFVHGSAGSASQFQSQAKRLASNGYPIDIVEAHEYDSPNIAAILPDVYAGLDARISRLLAATGADRVDLLAHSLGTFVTQGYLNSSPTRAARVAHYVNLDGRTATSPPEVCRPSRSGARATRPAPSSARQTCTCRTSRTPRPCRRRSRSARSSGSSRVVRPGRPGSCPSSSAPPGLRPRGALSEQRRRHRRDPRGLPGQP
ncbi:alpha/beta fold hydrolase [Micromonospora sp. M12]